MSDPLSISAGIIAVLQLTASMVQYLNEMKDTSKDRQSLLVEISSVSNLLYTLKDLAERAQIRQVQGLLCTLLLTSLQAHNLLL
jgi:hypothetical protein